MEELERLINLDGWRSDRRREKARILMALLKSSVSELGHHIYSGGFQPFAQKLIEGYVDEILRLMRYELMAQVEAMARARERRFREGER